MVLGTILQTSATESVQMIVARIVTGIGNGINTVNVPVWQAESFKTKNRGVSLPIQPVTSTLTHRTKGAPYHSECTYRLRSSAQHIHGSSQQPSRTLFFRMEVAHRVSRSFPHHHSGRTTVTARVPSVAGSTRQAR